jgi:hypothetical protein
MKKIILFKYLITSIVILSLSGCFLFTNQKPEDKVLTEDGWEKIDTQQNG